MSWGYHLMLDCSRCLPYTIRNKNNIIHFAKHLVRAIDMVPYGEPQVVHFGSGDKSGFTLVQLIETSNITGHFVEETNDAYIDVFSCKPFTPHIVEGLAHTYFGHLNCNKNFVYRQAPHIQKVVSELQ
jgi:S-adenosylmethionine/arginine decarboxylase-like enzyme